LSNDTTGDIASKMVTTDYDYRAGTWSERDQHEANLRHGCPVAYSERHDGHWVVTRFDDQRAVLADPELFSSDKYMDEDGIYRGGANIPSPQTPGHKPLEMGHSPRAVEYRRLMTPYFARSVVDRLRPFAEAWATELVDRVIERGQMDVVLDFGNPLPALTVLELIGLGTANWERYAMPNHVIVSAQHGTPRFLEAAKDMEWIRARIMEAVQDRRVNPRGDMISALCAATVEDAPIPDADIASMVLVTIAGGVDTTTVNVASAVVHLDADHALRDRLIAEPLLMRKAVEEFLRVYPPVTALCRTVTEATEIRGQRLAAGDRHLTFGHGIHRCVGLHIARMELEVMLTELLRRVPDFVVDHGALKRYSPFSHVRGFDELPITFTPGVRVGDGVPASESL
jgi:cytochrome P450